MSAVALAPIELRRGHGEGLDDVIVHVWEDLTEGRGVACPVCGGDMQPRYGAGVGAVGGRCKNCDTKLT